MADRAHRKERKAREMIQYFFILNICQTIYPGVASLESQGQAFIQTDNELRYMGDGVLLQVLSPEQDYTAHDGMYSSSPITFDPPLLDFEEQPVGMPHMQQVTVQNRDPDKSLHLLSISGSTQHFHCSFFQDKKVPPGGNTTFEVVFLARQVGNVENTLYIHTSKGSYRYQVFGVGIPNPYRIRPILGAKVPINSSFSPLIHMHNPHSSTLQVQEIFTTGGDLHLELPTGEKEAPKELWEIPPYETKPIMKASFLGRIEDNHTAFIRIRTNKEQDESILVLPVEVEVSSAPGIYSPLEMLDFGILRTQDEPKTLRLSLLNSGPKPAYITNVTVHPANPAISIEFRPTQLKHDILHPAPVALVSFNASMVKHPRHWSGSIKVHTKQKGYELIIPYQANIYKGSLGYDRNSTLFYTGDSPSANITRDLTVSNTFNFTLVVYNITLGEEMLEYFSIENFKPPVFLRPQQSVHIVTLRFNPQGLQLHFNSVLQLHTNASRFTIPISVYDGMLKVIHHRPETQKGQLDFGTLGVGERRSMTFTLRNDNPIDITVTKYYNNMEKASIELVGIEEGNGTFLQSENSNIPSSGSNDPFVLPPYHFAVFTVNLIAPNMEGHRSAQVMITWKFDVLPQKQSKELFKYIPITLTTAEGSLKLIPSKLLLEQCFPGKYCRQNLIIHSSFRVKMSVWKVTFSPPDNRFYYISRDEFGVPLAPYKDTDIGTIYFDLKRDCVDECYVGLSAQSHALHHWLLGCALGKDVADTDQYLYTRFQQRWQELISSQTSMINVTMNIDTDKAHGFLFQVQAHLHWPSIAKKTRIHFPLTQIGNISVTELLLENPADVAVVIQVLPLAFYPSPHTMLELLADSLSNDLSDFIDTEDPTIFTLPSLDASSNSVSDIEAILGVKPHRNSLGIVLPGGKTKKISVGFQPKDDTPRTSLLLIRNNLTIIDAVVVTGQGGRGEIRFSNRKPGSSNPLLFEMTDKHLKNCDKKRQNKSIPPNFSVKRTFTARNIGQLPLYVLGFSINNSPCEGYGFKVLDCHGFELQPNSSRKIDLVFTPDFTMSRIRRVLTLHTSLGPPINYTLQATIPAHMLSKCAAALPRPHWEPIIYYSAICIMSFLLFCIFVAAYFEADRIFHSDMFQRKLKVSSSTQTFDKGKVFDLKTIAGVRGHDGQAPPNCQYPNSRLMNNNIKGYSLMANGQVEMLPPHGVRRSRRETPNRSTRLLIPLRFLWNSIWSWTWMSGNGSILASGGVTKDSSVTAASSSSKLHKNTSGDKNGQDSNCIMNGRSESHRTRRAPAKESSSLISRVVGLISPFSSSDSSKPSSSTINSKKQHTEKVGGKMTHNNVQHSCTDVDPSAAQQHSNRKTTTDREPSAERLQLPQVLSCQQLAEDDADDEETSRKEIKKQKQKRHRLEQKRPKEKYSDLDRDDTSSTTTESSSCLEADDKAYNTRDTTPDLQPPKSKKSKNKSRRERVKAGNKEEDDNGEEYIIGSKSKALKVTKGDGTESFGGNILRPSTLELPYTTKLEARESNSGADQLDLITTTSGPSVTGRNGKTGKHKNKNTIDGTLSQELNSLRDAHDPGETVWDMPCRQSPGDLSQLAIQTEQFLKSQQNKLTDDLTAVGSRSPTFSRSISSDLSELSAAKSHPGKYPPTPGGIENNSPTGGSKHPGAIGSKPVVQSGISPEATSKKSPWSRLAGSGSSPPTSESISMNNSFGLHPVQEDISSNLVNIPDVVPLPSSYQNNIFPGLQDGLGPLNIGTYGQHLGPAPAQPVSSSVLMQLQAERRQRRLDYQQNLHSRENWPGSDIARPVGGPSFPSEGSVWDHSTVPNSTDAWSTRTDSPQRSMMPDTWASNPVLPVSTSANWSASMWGATTSDLSPNTRSSLMNLTPPLDTAAPATSAADVGSASFVGRFDPFSPLASIWNPSSSPTYTGSSWGLGSSDKPDN